MRYDREFYPFFLSYTIKDYIWGGKELKLHWNKQSAGDNIAESWEMSANEGGESIVLNGEYKGQSLKEVLQKNADLCGSAHSEVFPLLVKLINAETPLSVQVHPDDEYAMKHEGKKGKCEMWYICDAKEGASIYLGLNQDISRSQLEDIITKGEIEKYLNKVKVKAGDYYLVPAGTLHAIGAGLTILEVQQNSDLTYRVYDYNRVDKNGQKRQLHIEKAVAVTDCNRYIIPEQNKEYIQEDGFSYRTLATSQYFSTHEAIINKEMCMVDKEKFCGFTVIDGDGHIGKFAQHDVEPLKKGDTVFVPAGCDVSFYGKMKIIAYQI